MEFVDAGAAMPMPDGTPCCAGSVVLDQLSVMKATVGEEAYERALSRLAPEQQEDIRAIVAVSWVSPALINGFMNTVADEVGADPEEFYIELVRTGVERTMKTLWRILLRLTSDNALVSRTPLIYSKTYDTGRLTSHIETPGIANLRLEGWPAAPRMELVGLQYGIETTLRCAGRRNAKVTFKRLHDGALFTATWDR